MSTRHLLVTNDFPPKLGGIQQYLWELWRRLDPTSFEVHTTPYEGTEAFDRDQPYRVVRSREPFLIPYPWLPSRLDAAADVFGADLTVLDPAVPLGAVGPLLKQRYVVVLHGAEVAIPGRLPGTNQVLARVLDKAHGVIAAGEYALAEAERCVGRTLRSVVIPPGVDVQRYRPLEQDAKLAARRRFGIAEDAPFIFSVSRLVPRKGMDTLIAVSARLALRHPGLQVCIAGDGRDRARLQRRIDATGAPVRLLGRISDDDKADLLAAADIFSMLCRTRWNGLEQEGFGIVFVEAAAAGTPQIAGSSGGAHEAVADGITGTVIPHSASIADVTNRFSELLDDADTRHRMGQESRRRAEVEFSYDTLAKRLEQTLESWAAMERTEA